MKVSDVATAVGILLQDVGNVRWTVAEIILWCASAQKAICGIRPDAHTELVEIELVAGARQTVPATAQRLLDITGNVDGKAVTICDREDMDAFDPTWASAKKTKYVSQFMYDAEDAKTFYVTPPNDGNGKVKALCATFPAAPDDPTDELGLDAKYDEAVIAYVMYKCYSKEGEFNPRAGEYLSLFTSILQGDRSITIGYQPEVKKKAGSPDVRAQATGGV